MKVSYLAKETGAEIADICTSTTHAKWVRSKARRLDIEDGSEYSLAWKLSHVMKDFVEKYRWIAVSSNNIFWKETQTPISAILVQFERNGKDEFKTIINPELTRLSNDPIFNIEGCGSIGEPLFT